MKQHSKKPHSKKQNSNLSEFCQFAFVATFAALMAGIIMWWLGYMLNEVPPDYSIVNGLYRLLVIDYGAYCVYKLGLKASLNSNGLGVDASGKTFKINAKDTTEADPVDDE